MSTEEFIHLAGFVATGPALFAAVAALFWRTDRALSDTDRQALSQRLRRGQGQNRPWPHIFVRVFDTVLGDRPHSFLRRSLAVSWLSFLLAVPVAYFLGLGFF